jgi:hypothetical protein
MNKTLLLAGASAFALTLGMLAPSYAADGARADATGTSSGNTAIDDGSQRTNSTVESWEDGATGVVHNQQNNGNNNAINAATAVHADVTGGTALTTGATATSTSTQNDSDHNGDHNLDRDNHIVGTMNGFVGSATHQQNNGDNNAINSATALDGVDGDVLGVTQNADATATSSYQSGEPGFVTDTDSLRGNLLEDDLNGAAGVFTSQQNNGNGNAMSTSTAAAGATGNAGIVDQDTTATTFTEHNDLDQWSGERSNLIENAFNEAAGVVTVQQNNGDANAISASTAVTGVGGDAASIDQSSIAGADFPGVTGASNNQAGQSGGLRENLIDPSFQDFEGVATVQQNNGSGNAIAATTSVAAVAGSAGSLTQGAGASLFNSGSSLNVTDDSETNRFNSIFDGSFNRAEGVITVQQNNGDANSIAAANAVAAVVGDVNGETVQNAFSGFQGPGSSFNQVNSDYSTRENYIADMHGMKGVTTVQQNNGDANNMSATNAVAAVGSTDGLRQGANALNWSAFNSTSDMDSERDNLTDTAFHGYKGVLTVQQNNGSANSVAAANAVAAAMGDSGDVNQFSSATGFLFKNDADDDGSRRVNKIENSFHGLKGVATVQQNNGDANSINVSNAVAAVTGEAGNAVQNVLTEGVVNETTGEIIDHGTGTFDNGAPRPHRDNSIDPSFNNVSGIVTVQQNNGNHNTINAANAALVTLDGGEDTNQTVSATGSSFKNHTADFHSTRRNTLDDASFDNFEGMATIQQNNGDANSMNASTGAVANLSEDGKLNDVDQAVSTMTRTWSNDTIDLNLTFDGGPTSLGNRVNRINEDVFNGAQGIVTIQQNNGNGNAMATATAVRADIGATETDAPNTEEVFTQNVSTDGGVNSHNHAIEVSLPNGDVPPDARDYERANLLTDAFNGGVNGVFTIQQNNGDGNNIAAATGIAANIDTDGDIDSTIDNNATTTGFVKGEGEYDGALDLWANRHNTVKGPIFSGAAGIMTVQQNNGNNNVMGSAVGVVANVNTVKRFGEGGAEANSAGDATVEGNGSISTSFTDRLNDIQGAFDGAQGVMTVQQNNGDNNVMGAATDVVATTELPGFGPAASNATLGATVSDNFALNTGTVGAPGYSNVMADSFNGASGVMTAQQNNGNNSAMQSAVSVIANGINFGFNGGNPP